MDQEEIERRLQAEGIGYKKSLDFATVVSKALSQLGIPGVISIPVFSKDDPSEILGCISITNMRSDIAAIVSEKAAERHQEDYLEEQAEIGEIVTEVNGELDKILDDVKHHKG
jgi:hypothetical protein